MEAYFKVGIITGTHGLKGEVKVFPTTDDPYRYDDLKHVELEDRGRRIPLPFFPSPSLLPSPLFLYFSLSILMNIFKVLDIIMSSISI